MLIRWLWKSWRQGGQREAADEVVILKNKVQVQGKRNSPDFSHERGRLLLPPRKPRSGLPCRASQAASGFTRGRRVQRGEYLDCKLPSPGAVFAMEAPMQRRVQRGIVPTQTVHYKYVKPNHLKRRAVFQPCLPLHFSGLLLVGLIKLAIVILPESWLSSPSK